MQNNTKKLLRCINNESKVFLKDDMSLEILSSHEIDDTVLERHIAFINLTGSITYIVMLSIDDNLLDALFNIFFSDGVEDAEKAELQDALPDEIANTVVGLAIGSFPSECNNLELSPPYHLTQKEIATLVDESVAQNFHILTCKGNFYCSIFMLGIL